MREAPDPVFYEQPLLKPYVFFDVSHGREQRGGTGGGSLRNQVALTPCSSFAKYARCSQATGTKALLIESSRYWTTHATGTGPHARKPRQTPSRGCLAGKRWRC